MMVQSSLRPGLVGDGLAAVHVFFFLDAFGRQFEGPGENQGQREADDQHDQDGLDHPVGRVEILQHQVGNLRQQPGRDQVDNPDAEDVAALEFLEETHVDTGSSPSFCALAFRCSIMRDWMASYSGSPSKSLK